MNPQTAFPLGGDFAQAQRTGSVNGGSGDLKTMASIRLARLRIAANIEDGEDLAIAQRIAAELDVPAINAEIATLSNVIKASAARRQQQPPPRGVPPRPAPGVGRTVPPMTRSAGLRTASRPDAEDADLALVFLSEQALSS
jgi:hypothetical protein